MLHNTQRTPNISGLQASLTEPSMIILALIRIIIDKAGGVVANSSNIHRLLVKGHDNSTLLRSQGPLIDQDRRPLYESYLGGCPLTQPSLR